MSDIKRTLGEFTTPPGRLCFPHLNEPDSTFAEEEKKLKFKTSIRLSGDAATEFLLITEKFWADWKDTVKAATGKKPKVVAKNIQWLTADTTPWEDIGEGTAKLLNELQPGEAFFKTSCKAFRDGVASPPKFFDAKGVGIKSADVPRVGSGTEACLNGWFYGYTVQGKVNLSLILRAVQIIDLREPGEGPQKAEDFGFKERSGFVSESEVFAKSDDQGGDY